MGIFRNNPDGTIKELENKIAAATKEISLLRSELNGLRLQSTIFDKAFRAGGIWGDYLEFGTFRGDSFASAYAACKRVHDELTSGLWDHAFDNKESHNNHFRATWDNMRFIGFDSFEGIPKTKESSGENDVFNVGTYACGERQFLDNISRQGVDLSKVTTVKGFFDQTLNTGTATRLNLSRVAVVHVDSDLYESAKLVLDFVTPYLIDGAIIVFDEWYQFMSSPYHGERRAFREWHNEHPEWIISGFHKEGPFRNSFVVSKRTDSSFLNENTPLYS